ncbi:MAG: hypothetical protein GY893_03185 [bacterium]|nr:hypothetical protein [bacterium]
MGLVIKRGFWLIVAVVVSLLWVEVFTRVLLPQSVDSTTDIFQDDSVTGFSYIPGAEARSSGRSHDVQIKINSLGLRNDEFNIDKKDTFRILVLGNSFSLSYGCEIHESLPASFQKALEDEFADELNGKNIQVINASVHGYRTFHYWKGYHKWADKLNPDVVLVTIIPAEDFKTLPENTRYVVEGGTVLCRYQEGEKPVFKRVSNIYKFRKYLSRNSEFYILLRNFIYYNDKIDNFREKKGEGAGAQIKIAPYEVPLSSEVKDGWNYSYEYLSKIKNEADADSIKIVVVSIPVKAEIKNEYLNALVNDSNYDISKLDLSQPAKELGNYCNSHGIDMLNPCKSMLKESKTKEIYFKFDDHWNKVGINVAAVEMAKQWRELGLPIER